MWSRQGSLYRGRGLINYSLPKNKGLSFPLRFPTRELSTPDQVKYRDNLNMMIHNLRIKVRFGLRMWPDYCMEISYKWVHFEHARQKNVSLIDKERSPF